MSDDQDFLAGALAGAVCIGALYIICTLLFGTLVGLTAYLAVLFMFLLIP